MNVKEILNEQFKDLITEDTLNVIEEAFNQAVNEKSAEKIELETERVRQQLDEDYSSKLQLALEHVDNDHTQKLKKLIEAIDTDHAVKLKKLVEGIDKKHASMLQQVVEKYERELQTEAVNYQQRLVEEVSNYLDLYIDKHIPAKQINEAVHNVKAKKQLDEIRKIIGISEEYIDAEVKEALKDGKSIIDSLRSELNQTLKENVNLNARANKAEAHILLEKKTSEMPASKKQYISKLLGTKSPQYIEENFSYVVDMFEKEQTNQVDEIKESVKQEFTKAPRVDRQIIEEKTQTLTQNEIERTASSDSVSGYLNEMKNLSRFA